MDEELKVVVKSVLEADPEESAQRIAAQLPSISEKVNARSKIKIGVELNANSAQSTAQKISKTLSKAAHHTVGVDVKFDNDAIRNFQRELDKLGINDNITKAISAEMDDLGVRIDKISHAWKEAANGEKELLNLTIQGTDQSGQQVTIAKQLLYVLNDETAKLEDQSTVITRITADLEKQRHAEEKRAAQLKKEREDTLAFLQKQETQLERLRAKYTGETSTKPVLDETHLRDLGYAYQTGITAINEYRTMHRAMTQEEIADLKSITEYVRRMTAAYQNEEYVGTQLRNRDVKSVNASFVSDLDAYERKLQSSGLLTADFQNRIAMLREALSTAFNKDGLVSFMNSFDQLKADVGSFTELQNLEQKVAAINDQMQIMPTTLASLESKFNQLVSPTETLANNLQRFRDLMETVNSATDANDKIAAYEEMQRVLGYCNEELSKLSRMERNQFRDDRLSDAIKKLQADMDTTARTWSAFRKNINLKDEFNRIRTKAKEGLTWPELTKLRAEFNTFKSEVKAAGLNQLSGWDTFKNNLGKVTQWVSATTLLFRAFGLLKSGVHTVTELDTALVDLRKTTTMSGNDLKSFYEEANDAAKELGVTTKELIQSAADWSRLGYSDKNSATTMAKLAAQFAAISPGMDMDTATTGLVSIMKAYGMEANEVLDGIMSKINEVGNTAATNNAEIVVGLQNSASALAATNGTLEENIALFTAAQEIVQDDSKVGNALKTIALRVRGYNEETEELDETLQDISGDVIDLTKTLAHPEGVSLFTDATQQEYKSVGQYLHDISDIYDELEQKAKNDLLEKLFGKRQSNVGAAILSNMEAYDKALETMKNSAGSADREMGVITDSIEYRMNALGQTWVGVAQNLFRTDDIKAVITVLQALSTAVDFLTDKLGLLGTALATGGIIAFAKNLD